ncbi:Hypothetical protein A7982_07028 [Minicystis rosea]|nr:Hypothetical protein A7982_07028 [Minicystis rosea]
MIRAPSIAAPRHGFPASSIGARGPACYLHEGVAAFVFTRCR